MCMHHLRNPAARHSHGRVCKGGGRTTVSKHLSVTPELSVGGISQTVNRVYKPLTFTVSAFMRLGRGDFGDGSVRMHEKQNAPLVQQPLLALASDGASLRSTAG
ncbi:hypothetical protein E2C01_045853 [Portunus trituberculatus]|uniref:Uncharacterized protein n=1 Tax=Portunus trituberculatus TaxID=210409 RepID=A0A5B7G636_PORTR|nr:hypothetical protein [Portunus trituberculatus]